MILYGVYFQGERGSREHYKGAYEHINEAIEAAKGFGFHGIDGLIILFEAKGFANDER